MELKKCVRKSLLDLTKGENIKIVPMSLKLIKIWEDGFNLNCLYS